MNVSEILDKEPCPSDRSGHRMVAVGNCLILFGGYTQRPSSDSPPIAIGELKREVWCFHIPTETWKLLHTNEENFPVSTASCAVVAHGTNVIVFGGSGCVFGQSNSNKLQILDVKTLDWRTKTFSGDAIEGGYGHSISITDDGFLYLYGGCDGTFYFNSMNKICLRTWNNKSFFRHNHTGKYRHESIAHEGKIMIFGGGNPFAVDDLGIIPYFCTATDTWQILKAKSGHNPPGRMAHSCNKVNNHVIVTGGQVRKTISQGTVFDIPYNDALSDIWLFNLDTSCWSELSVSLPQKVFFHSGAVGCDGNLYTFGGSKYVSWNTNDGILQRITKRMNNLYKVEIFVPTLIELAWAAFYDKFDFLDSTEMLELGIPEYFVKRII